MKEGVILITYTERKIEKEDLALFRKIEKVINLTELPDLGVNESGCKIDVSCHMVAEATSRIFDVEIRHGYFMIGYEHSWVCTKNLNIIDVYPWGAVGGPLLIARQIVVEEGPIYISDESRDFRGYVPEFDKAVDLVEASMREAASIDN